MDIDGRMRQMDAKLNVGISFDIVKKELLIGGKRRACLYYINPFSNSEIISRILAFLLAAGQQAELIETDVRKFLQAGIPYAEFSTVTDQEKALYFVYSGASLLIIDGVDEYCILDVRRYLQRSVDEPQKDKVLRGSHDGFVEALLANVGLIRRRIKDKNLIFEKMTVGSRSGTDIAICYIKDLADKREVDHIRNRISSLQVEALPMGQESLVEVLIERKWYNPFPKVRYTERPDSASAMLLEGSVVVLCDNNPAAMMLPTSIFDFLQDTDDFSFPPMVGGYLKLVRSGVYVLSLLATPLWYLFVRNPHFLPSSLQFICEHGDSSVPLIVQLLMVELAVDGLKLASLNTPEALSSSLGIIGGLILGELATKVGWFAPQVIFYMSFAAIANFTQPSYELGYAFKFMRMLTLLLIAIMDMWGLLLGVLITFLLIATNAGVGKRSYLYPLFPFNRVALRRLLFRSRLKNGQKQPVSRLNDQKRH